MRLGVWQEWCEDQTFKGKAQETKNTHCELIMLKEPLRNKQRKKENYHHIVGFLVIKKQVGTKSFLFCLDFSLVIYTHYNLTLHTLQNMKRVERSTNGQGFYIEEEIECSYVVWPLVALKGFFFV